MLPDQSKYSSLLAFCDSNRNRSNSSSVVGGNGGIFVHIIIHVSCEWLVNGFSYLISIYCSENMHTYMLSILHLNLPHVDLYLHYCNSLFFDISDGRMSHCSRFRTMPLVWLLVLGAVTTTPVLRLLHWLPDW